MKHSHRYFCNAECEYFPCHKGADPESFNCLFCFCPLYSLTDCGGDFVMRGKIKDCSGCVRPHAPGGYEHVMERLRRRFERLRSEHETRNESESHE